MTKIKLSKIWCITSNRRIISLISKQERRVNHFSLKMIIHILHVLTSFIIYFLLLEIVNGND